MAEPQEQLPSHSLRRAASQMELSAVATPAGVEDQEIVESRISSPLRDATRRFTHNWAAMLSLIIIVILCIMAAFAPFMHTMNPLASDYSHLNSNPGAGHWFGTDGVGRDYYSRTLYGLRVPLIVGILGAAITTFLGALLGVVSGYFGGAVDSLLSRFTDLMFAFPGFLLAFIVVAMYGQAADSIFPAGSGRVIMLIFVFGIVGWPGLMRFVRSLALSMREQQFIEAAKTSGTRSWSILTRHLLPNMYGLILVQASFLIVGFVYTEAVLSIFGLGVEPPSPDLGQMIWDGTQVLSLNPWEAIIPSIFLTIIIVAFTFLGDGVRDAVDPRSTG